MTTIFETLQECTLFIATLHSQEVLLCRNVLEAFDQEEGPFSLYLLLIDRQRGRVRAATTELDKEKEKQLLASEL